MDTYGLVPGKDDVLGVGMVVDNVPEKFSIELGGHQAVVARNKKLPGAGNKREIYATVNFANEIDRMRKRPDESLDLLVKVFDQEDSENYETQRFPIEPTKLGLDAGKPAPKGPVKIDKGKVTVIDKKPALLKRRAAAAAVGGRRDNKGHAAPAAHEATTAP